jgi:hypothetical protein
MLGCCGLSLAAESADAEAEGCDAAFAVIRYTEMVEQKIRIFA